MISRHFLLLLLAITIGYMTYMYISEDLIYMAKTHKWMDSVMKVRIKRFAFMLGILYTALVIKIGQFIMGPA